MKRKLKGKWADYFLGYPPRTGFSREYAAIEAGKMAERDILFVKKRHNIVVAKTELAALQEEMEHMMKINPWLEEEGKQQKDRVGSIKTMIESMTQQVRDEEEKKYTDYLERLDVLSKYPPVPSARYDGNREEPVPKPMQEQAEEMPSDKVAEDLDLPPLIKKYSASPEAYVKVEETNRAKAQSARPKLKPVMKKQAPFELPKEIKATIFRMNRRLYKLEQSFDPLEGQFKVKLQKLNLRATHIEDSAKVLVANDDRMREDIKRLFEQDKRDHRARTVGWLGVLLAILAILLSFKADILGMLPK